MDDNVAAKEKHCNEDLKETTRCPHPKSDPIATTREQTRLEIISVFLSSASFVVQCLLCYVLLFVVMAPWLPLITVFYLLKLAERAIVKMTSGGFHLTGMDALWVQHSDENQLTINALLFFENLGNVEEGVNNFRQAILERLVDAKKSNGELLFPRVRCYVRPGWFQYFYQDDQIFKIENHVFKWEGEVPCSKAELATIISKLSNEPLPEERSPWCCCCIPTNFGDNDIAVVFRLNHSIADGFSVTQFLIHKLPDTVIPQKGPQNFSSRNRSLLLAKAALITPMYLLKGLLTPADRSLLHGPDLSGVKKVAWHEAFELQLIKKIKSATGTTVNDVLMSCLSLAVRRYFQRKGIKNPDDFTASVAVNVRSSAVSKELVFENRFSVIFPKLAVATDGVLKLLYETKARMDVTKISGEPLASAAIMSLPQELCPEFLTSKVNTFVIRKASCVFSNLPGPQHMLTVRGSRLKYMIFWPPQKDNIGVALSIFTYAGKVIVGVQSDVSVLSDPEIIVEEFGNAVNEMATCVLHTTDSVSNGHVTC